MKHSVEDRMYICLLLNRLFLHIVPEDAPNKTDIAMEWLAAIRQVDQISLTVRGGYSEPFCVIATRNNYECFNGDLVSCYGKYDERDMGCRKPGCPIRGDCKRKTKEEVIDADQNQRDQLTTRLSLRREK